MCDRSYTLIVDRVDRDGGIRRTHRPFRSYQRACAEARRIEDADSTVTATDVVCRDALDPDGIAVRRAWRDVQGGVVILMSRFFSHHGEAV